jgi:exosortase family protein XrtM
MSRATFKDDAGTTNHSEKLKGHFVGSLKSRLQSWYANKSPVFRFGLKMVILMAFYYGISLVPTFDRLLYNYLCANARICSAILNLLGQTTKASEVAIRSAHYGINLRRGCDAIEPAWFFCSAVLAFPASLMRKLPGITVGVVLILCLNFVRIVSLYFIRLYYPGFFSVAHLEIWPTVFILTGILLWAGWTRWIIRKTQRELHLET